MSVMERPAPADGIELLTTADISRRLGGVPDWALRRTLDQVGLHRKVGMYRVVLSTDLPALKAALRERGYLKPAGQEA